MQLTVFLIDKASEICGSDAELSRRLGVSRAYVSQIRAGKRPITPEIAGLLADIAGEDPSAAVMAVLREKLAQTERGRRVLGALERRFLAGAVAMCAIFATDHNAIALELRQHVVNTIYIVSSWIEVLCLRTRFLLRNMPRCGIRAIVTL